LKIEKLVWQESHCFAVGIWFVGFPSALTLLWQSEQRPTTDGLIVAWSGLAAVAHDVVEVWQVSHWAAVAICVDGLDWAFCVRKEPLWQVEQFPAATGPLMLACMPLTPTEMGAKDTPAAWQESHEAEVGMWAAGLPVARVPL
jgi:hypothetical protein